MIRFSNWDVSAKLSIFQATLIVVLSAVCFGTVPLFAKVLLDKGIASPAIAFYRYALTAILFIYVLPFRGPLARETMWALVSGACVGFGWISYVEALKIVPISSVSVIYMTYPLFTLLASWLLIKNKPGKRALFASLLVLIAAVLAFLPEGLSNAAIKALLLAFCAPLTFGLSIAILTDKLECLAPLQRLVGFATGASLGLIPLLIPLQATQLFPSNPEDWSYVVLLALFTAFIPQFLYSSIAPRIGPAKSAMAGSIELPTMLVIGIVFFNEHLTFLHIISVSLVLIAILITPAISSHRRVVDFENHPKFSVIGDENYESKSDKEQNGTLRRK